MPQRIFLAGAAGAIGQRMLPLLRDAGHRVVGTTRSAAKAESLRAQGVEPVVVDVFDAEALARAVKAARPDVVIHQLTDLPKNLEPSLMAQAISRNARIRSDGTRNLVRSAKAAGVRRIVAQSIGWAYAPGPEPHAESDPLDGEADGDRGITLRGVIALEELVLRSPPLQGIVLRYGQLYGPGTHSAVPSASAPVHVDAAAYAAVLAIDRGRPGAYNIAQPNKHIATEKARRNWAGTPASASLGSTPSALSDRVDHSVSSSARKSVRMNSPLSANLSLQDDHASFDMRPSGASSG